MTSTPDDDYKTIFSYPEMVEDIIIHFAPGPWLAEIDFSTLEPFKSSFVSDFDQPEGRHSDLIWRVRYKDSWLYVYLLFEFQSTINKFMALRMLVYVGLLYQDLIKNKYFDPDGKLPFILPIVLYNGTQRWNAPLSTEALITKPPKGLDAFLPKMAYFPIDEGSYTVDELESLNSLAALVFLLESQTTMEGLRKGLDKVLKWPDDEKRPTLHIAIANLVTRVWHKKLPNVPMPRDGVNDLKGVFSMLSENIDIMIAESAKKARVQGLEQGNADMFKTMVTIRFGSVPEHIAAQIDAASPDQLAEWGKRLFILNDIEAVFSPN
jgi:Putative transposase, YhgA-like